MVKKPAKKKAKTWGWFPTARTAEFMAELAKSKQPWRPLANQATLKAIGHSHPIFDRIPVEIFHEIGLRLNGPSFLAALQVSKLWYRQLRPLLWHTITSKQWYNLSFPDQKEVIQHAQELRHLEWACKEELHIHKYVRSKRQMTLVMVGSVLKKATNLRSLGLTTWTIEPPVQFVDALLSLPNLKRLDANMDQVGLFQQSAIRLEVLFPLLSRLHHLSLNGHWYTIDAEMHKGPLQSTDTPWRMKGLRIRTSDMPLLRYCVHLEELYLEGGISSIRSLVYCTKLRRLRMGRASGPDGAVILPLLKHLEALSYHPQSPAEIDLLSVPNVLAGVSPVPDQRILHSTPVEASDLALPLLKHLEIVCTNATSSDGHLFERAVFDVLKCRKELRSLDLKSFSVDPREIFSSPGLECQEWACKELVELSLSFKSNLTGWTKEARCKAWGAVYHQIGKLKKLKKLKIRCFGLEKGSESRILELSGATGLRHVTLVDANSTSFWTKDEACLFSEAVPRLKSLAIESSQQREVTQWLRECRRPLGERGAAAIQPKVVETKTFIK
ncbi:hypothetical protein BGX28_000363 [Mortierella sp. GBA30]|nr:hypothetical protein BGX28_000363 [Mortierella sp. GBA30]